MRKRFGISRTIGAGLLALGLALAGCAGEDGKDGVAGAPGAPGIDGIDGTDGTDGTDGVDGAPGPAGPAGPAGEPGAFAADIGEAHAITGVPAVSNVAFAVNGEDLVVTFNLKVDGANATGYTKIYSRVRNGVTSYTAYRFYDNAGTYTRDSVAGVTAATDNGGGNYTITVPGAAANGNSRYLFRVTDAVGTVSAIVVGDYPSAPKANLASNQACVNCHGAKGQGIHYSYPMGVEQCVVCHDAGNTSYPRLTTLIHGVHNSHNMPSGHFELDEETTFSVTYPTYMQNCSVCHDTAESLATVNAKAPSFNFCMTCHENWNGFGGSTFGGVTHTGFTATADCSTCHNGAISAKQTVKDFHNGLTTERAGLIWDGRDVSVDEGAKIAMQITGVTRTPAVAPATEDTLAVTWTATYDGTAVDPCNTTATATAPTWQSGFSLLRAYGLGDDWVNDGIGTAPGQPVSTNLSFTGGTPNTVCAGNVATTTITLTPAEQASTADKGIVALQGKPKVLHTASGTEQSVRAKTPTREFVVATGAAPATSRRPIVDTASCLKCHVGSLYQHGGNRIDNVDLCVMCHNPASSEQNVRVGDGVDASEAYDRRAGQTYELKSLLHAVHSAGETGAITMIYRTMGNFVWAGEGTVIPNYPTVDVSGAPLTSGHAATVFGSNPAGTNPAGTTRVHNLHVPTYPQPLNACSACHKPDTYNVFPDPTKAVATTAAAGAAPWGAGNDDTLLGASAAACMSCHQSSVAADQVALRAHAYQNGWAPKVFTNGRQDIIDAATSGMSADVEACSVCHKAKD